MASARRYDRKVRVTLGIFIGLSTATVALALRGCVSHLQSGARVVAAPYASADDQLIELRNGTTMLLDRGPLNAKVVDWLKLDTGERTAFEIDDANFDRGSANPAVRGYRAIAQVAQILRADRELRAELIVARDADGDRSAAALERLRAARVSAELRRQGVSSEQVEIAPPASGDLENQVDGSAQRPRLFLVLSR